MSGRRHAEVAGAGFAGLTVAAALASWEAAQRVRPAVTVPHGTEADPPWRPGAPSREDVPRVPTP